MMIRRRQFLGTAVLTACGSLVNASVVKRTLPAVDLGFIKEKMTLFSRQDWSSEGLKPWRVRGIGSVDRITVHHTAGGTDCKTDKEDVAVTIRGIMASHAERGYGDIAYHLIVDYAGCVWEGRSLAYEGAHVQDQNIGNIGVVFLGNFQLQDPSGKQINSLKQLVSILRRQYRIKKHRIYGHRDLGASACPGDNLYAYVNKLKEGKL